VIKQQIKNMNFISLKTRSLFTLMALSLFAISFTMISDEQTAYGIEVFPLQEILTEGGYGNIGILDVKITENGIYLLYWDQGNDDGLRFTTSVDDGVTWSTPYLLNDGLEPIFDDVVSDHIFINDLGHIGVGWVLEADGVSGEFALSTDNGLTFTVVEEVFFSNCCGVGTFIMWSGDGENIALTFSDEENQAVIVSNDFGTSWTETVLQNADDDVSSQNQGMIAVNEMNMYVIWNGEDDLSGEPHVYFTKSNDNGVIWDTPTQISTSSISGDNTQLTLNDDASKVLISWIGGSQDLVQAVSIDGGNTFGSPAILDDGSECDNQFDIDSLGEDVIFMCLGFNDAKRLVKISSDFGLTYSLNYTIFRGDIAISSSTFPENIGTGDNLYSLWEDLASPNPKFLSHTQDKGQTFNFDSIPGLEFATLDNGFLSRQGVFDKSWYWFVQADSTTLSFVKAIAAPVCTTLTFDDLPPGTIVTDQLESIGLTISAENNKHSHPDAAIIFNSADPTGEDFDLGTPNETFGGPGIGEGGEAGEPGENAIPLGNLLIIAEDIIDVDPHDGLVDDPDDEAKGGHIQFNFEFISTVQSITLVDIDSNENGGSVMVMTTSSGDTITIPIEALGDNSVQTIAVDLDDVTDFKVELVSSGAIATIDYCLGTEPVPEPGPTIITGIHEGNLKIGPDDEVIIDGATINGNVENNGGDVSMINSCTVNGNVKSKNGGNMSINSCTINGNVRTTDGGTLTITNDSTVTKNVNSKNAESVSITNNLNSFEKNVRVDGAAIVDISDNTITENLRVKDSGDVTLNDNTVEGNLRSIDNHSTTITGNTVTGNLNTKGTDTVTITGNMVEGNLRAAGSTSVNITGNTSGENLRVKDSSDVNIDQNQVGENLRVMHSSDVNIDQNQVGKNLKVRGNDVVSVTTNHAENNINIKKNTDCTHSGNTAEGKIRIRDCTELPP